MGRVTVFSILVLVVCVYTGYDAASIQERDISNTLERLDKSLKSLTNELKDEVNHVKYDRGDEFLGHKAVNTKRQTSANSIFCDFSRFSSNCDIKFVAEDHNENKPKWELRHDYSFIRDSSSPIGGSFWYADITDNHPKNEFTTLSAPFEVQGSSNDQCIEFSYLMYHHNRYCDTARFKVELVCGDKTTELFRASTTPSYKWYKAAVSAKAQAGSDCEVLFHVARGLGQSRGSLGVDDFKVTFGSKCSDSSVAADAKDNVPEDMKCDFEHYQDECLWKMRGNLPWAHANWGTPQGSTGPSAYFGHHLYRVSGGGYRYIDARKDDKMDKRGKNAYYISPELTGNGDKRMKMAYSMYGVDMGSLSIAVIENGKENELFKIEGDQGKGKIKDLKHWFDACVDLPSSGKFQIKIEGIVGLAKDLQFNQDVKSDIAIDAVDIEAGKCNQQQPLASCSHGKGESCPYVTEDSCGAEETEEFRLDDEFEARRGKFLTTIPRISKEFTISLKVKVEKKTSDWRNIIKFTESGRDCCWRGDRVPTLLILPNQLNVEVATQIGWNGNWHNKGINLQENKWHTIKMEQKKEADGKYYFYIHFDGQQMAKQHQDIPREKHNVKVWASDIFHEAGGVIIKDLLFQNKKGSFDECKAVCNKPLSDQDFDVFFDRTQKQETVIYENAAVMTPTKNSLVKDNFEVGQEYELSMEIKAKEKKGGWTNIVHVTSGSNCCDKGMRVPAVFIYSNDYRMHITAPVNQNGNHAYNDGRLKQDEWVKLVIQQKRDAFGHLLYSILIDDKEEHRYINSDPQSYQNMKMYLSDNWHNAPGVEIRNVVFKSFGGSAGTYPCPEMCKAIPQEEDINGTTVKTVTYTYETCKDREYQLSVQPTRLFTRYGCLHISYKMAAKSIQGTSHCDFFVQANRHNIKQIKLRGDGEVGKWYEEKFSIHNYWRRFGRPIIGIRGAYTRNHCVAMTFGEIRLDEGVCPGEQ